MPSSNERALEKARTIPCDALILDLEDAVAPRRSPPPRDAACAAAASGRYGRREVTIRVNARTPSGTPTTWPRRALPARTGSSCRRSRRPDEVAASSTRWLPTERRPHALWAMVETPRAMLHAEEIAAASERLTVL
jgi:citrate lyase subunit beta/citryl-CoA lyase